MGFILRSICVHLRPSVDKKTPTTGLAMWRVESSPNLAIAADDPLQRRQLFKRHRAAAMQLTRADPQFRPQPELEAIGEIRRCVDVNRRAVDVVQETFLKLCTKDRSEIQSSLAEWLYTVCQNRALDVR